MSLRRAGELVTILGFLLALFVAYHQVGTAQGWPPFETNEISEEEAVTFIDSYLAVVAGSARDLDAAWELVVPGSPAATRRGRPGWESFWRDMRSVERTAVVTREGEKSFSTTLKYAIRGSETAAIEPTVIVLRKANDRLRVFELRAVRP